MLNKVLIFSAGVLTGALGGFFVTKAMDIKRFNKDLNEIREHYKSKQPKEETPREEAKEEEPKKNIFQTSSIDMDRYKKALAKKGYEIKEVEPDISQPTMPTVKGVPITVNSKDFYLGEEAGIYESEELIYYEDDEVLATPGDEIVAIGDDVDVKLGQGNIDKYGEFDTDMLYVRLPKLENEDKGTQYMITVLHDSYENVTGISPFE